MLSIRVPTSFILLLGIWINLAVCAFGELPFDADIEAEQSGSTGNHVLYGEPSPGAISERLNQHSYPKIFIQIQDYVPSTATLNEAANWHVLVLDAELVQNRPDWLGESGAIRAANPNAVILLYFSAADVIPGNTATINAGFISGLNDGWYMKDIYGARYLLFELFGTDTWTQMLNLTTPVSTYMPTYLNNTVVSTNGGDGIFFDWIVEDMSWLNHRTDNPSGPMDIDNDSLADSDSEIDSSWVSGTTDMLNACRSIFPSETLVVGNGGWIFDDTYSGVLNGRMVEGFLLGESCCGHGWLEVMRGHYIMHQVSLDPKVSLIMANGAQNDYGSMRLALASTLMFDGYFAYTNSDGAYLSTWWYDEYSVDTLTGNTVKSLERTGYLGSAISEAYDVNNSGEFLGTYLANNNPAAEETVWRRDFERGIVLVNPSDSAHNVDLGKSYRKISGFSNREFNSGETVNEISLEPRSGAVLLNQKEESAGYFRILPDISGNGSCELVRGGMNPVNGAVMSDVKDASNSSLLKNVFFTGQYVPVALTVVPDFMGSGACELLMLQENLSTGAVCGDVRDASTGAFFRRLWYHWQYRPMTIEAMASFGGTNAPDVAVMARRPSDGALAVAVRDGSTGGLLKRTHFHADFLPVNMEVVPNFGDTLADELAVLGQRLSDAAVAVGVRDASSGVLLKRVFFSSFYTPLDLEPVSNFGDTSAPEIVVLSQRVGDGDAVGEVRDASTGNLISAISFYEMYSPLDIEVAPSFAGTSAPELVVLSCLPSSDGVIGEVRDASSGALLKAVSFNGDYRPQGIEILPNIGGSTAPELAVHGVNPDTGAVIGEVKDASSGILLRNTFFNPNYEVP
jgi:hypothetical protein